jgi:AraC-like DNA-binding protein
MNPGNIEHLFRLRSTLEAFSIVRWRRRSDQSQSSARLWQLMDRLRVYAAQGDYPAFHCVDNEIHRIPVASLGLPALLQSWELVVAELDAGNLEVKRTYWPSLMALYREHVLLLDAWHSADDWIAENATHQHVEAGLFRMAAALGDLPSDVGYVGRATAFMSIHFASHLEIDWIARHVSFISASHLTRLFRRQLGVSPYAFLKQVRLDRAAQLLRACRDPISTIAGRVGYKNTSHFVRDFHNYMGLTPLAYRHKQSPSDDV